MPITPEDLNKLQNKLGSQIQAARDLLASEKPKAVRGKKKVESWGASGFAGAADYRNHLAPGAGITDPAELKAENERATQNCLDFTRRVLGYPTCAAVLDDTGKKRGFGFAFNTKEEAEAFAADVANVGIVSNTQKDGKPLNKEPFGPRKETINGVTKEVYSISIEPKDIKEKLANLHASREDLPDKKKYLDPSLEGAIKDRFGCEIEDDRLSDRGFGFSFENKKEAEAFAAALAERGVDILSASGQPNQPNQPKKPYRRSDGKFSISVDPEYVALIANSPELLKPKPKQEARVVDAEKANPRILIRF